ncbi:MAG: SGNH/GDSL hydrolase family protein [Ruminococcus sp.]|nr:SGNH/GDSL hydrolase family protein [Ruminococcus sp.]
MVKKILAALVASIITMGIFASCGNKPTDDGSNSSNLESLVDETVDITKGASEKMLERSILLEGDTSRLAEKLNNAMENNKQITNICFLGDSITQGSAAEQGSNQYVNRFKTWWEENVSYYVDVTNAGIGATDSYIGVHRAQRDVLDLNPDIIFIEFINDTDDIFYKTCMDSLVKKCMEQENKPAVIMIEMTMDDGTSPQNVHSEIAKAYNVPMISYHDAIMPEIEAGTIKWTEISPDNIHPNDVGHGILAQLLTNFVGNIKDNIDSYDKNSKVFDADSPTGDKYADARLVDRNSDEVTVKDEGSFTESVSFQKFNAGWGTVSGGTATFEMEFKNLGLLYLKTIDGKSANVTITVDGKEVKPISGDFPGGWGDYAKADELYVSDEKAKHTVTITVDEGEQKSFQILSWMLS